MVSVYVCTVANADIYFDETLQKLPLPDAMRTKADGDADGVKQNGRQWSNTILALEKWIDKGTREHLQLHLRTDTQDAWIFQSPIPFDSSVDSNDGSGSSVVTEENLLGFPVGAIRCDNRIAWIFAQDEHYARYNYSVLNTPFAVHAIEYDAKPREPALYGTAGSILGDVKSLPYEDTVHVVF